MARELGYIVRFLLVGVLNTFVGLGSIYACKYFLGFQDIHANAIGYLLGLTNSFFWNKKWTFSHTGAVGGTVVKFLLVFGVAYVANLVAAVNLIRSGVNSYVAHAVATIPYTAIFYIGSRYFVFRNLKPAVGQ